MAAYRRCRTWSRGGGSTAWSGRRATSGSGNETYRVRDQRGQTAARRIGVTAVDEPAVEPY